MKKLISFAATTVAIILLGAGCSVSSIPPTPPVAAPPAAPAPQATAPTTSTPTAVKPTPTAAKKTPTTQPTPQAAKPAPTPIPAATSVSTFSVGSTILGKWKNGQHWYKGKITAAHGSTFDVSYTEGDTESEVKATSLAHFGAAVTGVKAGDAVIAKWANGNYYEATVTAVAGTKISVTFYDGYKLDVGPLDLALAGK